MVIMLAASRSPAEGPDLCSMLVKQATPLRLDPYKPP
jgi:hypothetical protein